MYRTTLAAGTGYYLDAIDPTVPCSGPTIQHGCFCERCTECMLRFACCSRRLVLRRQARLENTECYATRSTELVPDALQLHICRAFSRDDQHVLQATETSFRVATVNLQSRHSGSTSPSGTKAYLQPDVAMNHSPDSTFVCFLSTGLLI